VKNIKAGDGRPESLEITKEVIGDDQFQEIYIKPKDTFFDHYEVSYLKMLTEFRETS
jgi:hypothetical protein